MFVAPTQPRHDVARRRRCRYVDYEEESRGFKGRGTLHIIFDWADDVANRSNYPPLGPDCFNYFTVRTLYLDPLRPKPHFLGEFWAFRLYGDHTVRATLNGRVIKDRKGTFANDTSLISCASTGYGFSLVQPYFRHQINEISFTAQLGLDYLVHATTAGSKYTCDIMVDSNVGFGGGAGFPGQINRIKKSKTVPEFTSCEDITDPKVVNVSKMLDAEGKGCVTDPMDADPNNITWFDDFFTKSSVEKVVHGPYGRNDACFKTSFTGFQPDQKNISLQVRFMSFDNWEDTGKKHDEVTVSVNGQLLVANWRRRFCENEWIKYAVDGVSRGIDLWNMDEKTRVVESKDNCYYDAVVMVNASEAGWVNVSLTHNLEEPITDESMAFNDFKFGCFEPEEEPFFDLSFDRCVNYTNGTLNPGSPNPFYGIINGADDDQVEDFGGKRYGRQVVDPATGLTLQCETDDDWAMIEGTCYKVFPESDLGFDQVVDTTPASMFAFCSSLKVPGTNDTLGASFAEIKSGALDAAIREMAEEYYNPYFALQVITRRKVDPEVSTRTLPIPQKDLEYGWRALGSPYTLPCPAHILPSNCLGPDKELTIADYDNWADGFPSGRDGAYWDGKQCVYMNKDGQWQDVSCKATLEAEGVLCQAPPRPKTTAATTTTTVTTTTTLNLGPCDPRELESGAKPEKGGGKAGQSSYTSPNGWVVTAGTPTYSNKEYYWLSNVIDKSDSCRAPWSCAGNREGGGHRQQRRLEPPPLLLAGRDGRQDLGQHQPPERIVHRLC